MKPKTTIRAITASVTTASLIDTMINQKITPQLARNKLAKVVNGKLIVPNDDDGDYVNLPLLQLGQNFEQFKSQITTAQLRDRELYIKQLGLLKKAVDKVEAICRKLARLATAIVLLLILGLFLG